jgi:YihY family inner membrane protein
MNPVERAMRRADAAQQRHPVTAFLFAISKKFGDDNGGALVANLAYAAFVSVFPLLLILVTILVNVAAGDPSLRNRLISGATAQFPLVGNQLAHNIHALKRATAASLIAGLLLLAWGANRLAQAGLFTMAQVWNLPGPARPGYFPRLARGAVFLGVLALGVALSSLLGGLVTYGAHSLAFRVLAQALAGLSSIGLYFAAFRVLTPGGVPARRLVPGAVVGGIFWTALQAVGAYLVHHDLRSDSVYGIFATVLGLVAWIYLAAEAAVYAAEVNVVLARRLWPRAIVQPPLTDADRTSMALQALQNQRRPEQQVEVTFTDRPAGTWAAPSAGAAEECRAAAARQSECVPDQVTDPRQ